MIILLVPLILGYFIYRSYIPVPSFTLYFADWCGHCKAVLPLFRNFLYPGVTIRWVEQSQNSELKVAGFPSFVYRDRNGIATEFKGGRTIDDWSAFLHSQQNMITD